MNTVSYYKKSIEVLEARYEKGYVSLSGFDGLCRDHDIHLSIFECDESLGAMYFKSNYGFELHINREAFEDVRTLLLVCHYMFFHTKNNGHELYAYQSESTRGVCPNSMAAATRTIYYLFLKPAFSFDPEPWRPALSIGNRNIFLEELPGLEEISTADPDLFVSDNPPFCQKN